MEAAGLPLAALTAWQSLFDTADLRPGQTVLIHAAAGGVGHLAVQLAKWRGARVIGTASAPKRDFVRGLGADEVIDYRFAPFEGALPETAGRAVDVVLDAVGGDYVQRSLQVLRPGRIAISIPSGASDAAFDEAARLGVRLTGILVEPDHHALGQIAGLVTDGHLRAAIDTVLPLTQVVRAHELGETGRTQGKLVLRVGG